MEQLQYDPRIKQQIKDALYDFLYTPVQNQFKIQLDTLISQNTLLGKNGHKSFNYKGEYYSCDNGPPPRVRNRLIPQLRPQMDDYLKELNELNEKELPYVLGFINRVLNSTNRLDDYLRLLPESAHYPIEKLIAACPCQGTQLPDELVQQLRKDNETHINLMKARMVTNIFI